MTQINEIDFQRHLANKLNGSGYLALTEPTNGPRRNLWRNDPASLIRGPKFRPDILVERDGKRVIIETKSRPILLGDVIRAREYAKYFQLPVVICVPDDAFAQTRSSVREFSNCPDIRLSPSSRILASLSDVLSRPVNDAIN